MLPLCFILMPLGKKPAADGRLVDFDAVYEQLIKPAVVAAGLEPLRAAEEMTGGVINKQMYERLILCEYAVADLTTANAIVLYELGLRHAVRSAGTVLMFAQGAGQPPFDMAQLRAISYRLGSDGKPEAITTDREVLTAKLQEVRKMKTDSPVYQLVEGFPDIQRLKTDVFRERVAYSGTLRQKLIHARLRGIDEVRAVERELGAIQDAEAGIVIDLYLSYRAVKGWEDMIALVQKMSTPLAATVLVQEQLGFALNRAGRGEAAERVLLDLIASRGPSSETYGILGRVYKDRWDVALKVGEEALAQRLLEKAIDAYLKGFEADWRDAYPGINAVTLMELKEPPDSRREGLIPVVTYAVERRIASGKSDYWDRATLLELAVLAKDRQKAQSALADALAAVRESWEPETTARNLKLIHEARDRRNEPVLWAKAIGGKLWLDSKREGG